MPRPILLFVSLAFVFITGCAGLRTDTSHVPEIKSVQTPKFPYYEPQKPAEGSLWSELAQITLYPDNRARKIGDIVVVRVEEDPEAALNAKTEADRSSKVGASLKYLGIMKSLAASNPNLAQDPGNEDLIAAALSTGHAGDGTSNRTGHVKAYVSAVVVKAFPNGNLYINGKREIKVNHETQYIVVAGIIRPQDISTTNEISSIKVADARISYSGIGVIADKQRPGWGTRLLDYVWPF